MYLKYRTIIHLFGLLFLLALVAALAGCGGDSTETTPAAATVAVVVTPDVETAPATATVAVVATPDVETAPAEDPVAVDATPIVTVVTNPEDIEEVEPNEGVTIALEASGPNLIFSWQVARGTLSSSDGVSAIYTAPAEPGLDSVDIIITSDNGSTTKTVPFNVVAPEPPDTTQPKEEETLSSMPLTLASLEDGQTVPCENPLQGTYSEDEITGQIWPVVIVGGRWHPQDQSLEPALKAGGTWYGIARFGGCDDPTNSQGVTFQLFIIEADDICHDTFDKYVRTAADNLDWPGIAASEVPQSCLENVHAPISVVRQ